MKHKPLSLALAALALLGLGAPQAGADTVYMKGGDRLSGTIVSKDADLLTLKTSYSEVEIVIDWTEVESLETDKPARFMLNDRTLMDAQATRASASTVVLKGGDTVTTTPLAMSDIAYINPPPHVSGEGVSTSGRLNLGLTANRGNTDNDQILYDAEAVVRSLKNRFTIGATGDTRNEEGEETARRNRAYFKYDHFLTEKWYAYANTDVQEDKFKDLNLRTTLGGGAGYQFFDTEQRSLALEGGLTYVNEDYDLADDESFAAGRWAVRYMQFLWNDKAQFFHNDEGIVSVEDPDDTIFRSQTGLRFPLVENLNATLQYNIDWQNTPPEGFDSTDSAYIVSVGYLW